MSKPSIKHYIFYHDYTKFSKVTSCLDSSLFEYIDLNSLELLQEMLIPHLTEEENKAIFAEYLGIMSIKPITDMVGCFTYSIPLKFSAEWALETKCSNLFLPEIKFKALERVLFDQDKIYGPEFKNPLDKFQDNILDIHNKFSTGNSLQKGPFKGSFIVNSNIFYKAQNWLINVTNYLVKNYDFRSMACEPSIFGTSKLAQRGERQKELDKLRHTCGNILERALAYFLGNHYQDDKKIWLGEYLMTQKIKKDEMLKLAHKYKKENTIVIAISSNQYADVALSWGKSMNDLNISNYLVVAMEEELYHKLKENHINVALKPFIVDKDLGEFWTFRLNIIKSILDSGIDVIHSDTDALWLKDPLSTYFYNSKYDILASQGTIWPHDIVDKWGFVLCCGLIYYKSSPQVLSFFNELIKKSIEVREDQTALNKILFDKNASWDYKLEDYFLTYNDRKFKCFFDVVPGKCEKLTLGLLPHGLFQRYFEPEKNPYVAHLLSEKNADSKLNAIEIIKSKYPKNPADKKSNLVWLASYPRSGNTLLRIILNNNFSLKSYSIYNDPNDIGKIPEVREVVGHVDMDWSFLGKPTSELIPEDYAKLNDLRYVKNEHTLVKTHSPWHNGFLPDKAIYIYRDGRSALRSHASYNVNFTKSRFTEEEFLEQVIVCGAELPSTWNNHVLSWLKHPADKILVLKFEDVVSDFQKTFKKISRFLNAPIKDKNPLTFEHLHAINPQFFRKGKKKSWDDLFNKERNSLFWFLNNEAMTTLRYDNEKSSLCDLLPDSSKPAKFPCIKDNISEQESIDRDALLTECLNIIKNNIAKVNIKHKKVLLKNFIDSYAHCLIALSLHNSKPICFKNNRIFNQIINLPELQDYRNYWPYIYIATPTYNSSEYLDQAIHSVISQEGSFFIRYHIQDGSSTDGTVALLEKWKKRIDSRDFDCFCKGVIFTYHSCKDEGMYDALNKAFKSMDIPPQAIMSWINSDDIFLSGAFSLAFQSMTSLKNLNWLIGRKRTFGEHGELRGQNTYAYPTEIISAGLCDGYHWDFVQQEGSFWRNSLWRSAGGLNPNFKYAGDWDLWRRFAKITHPVHTPHPLGMFRKREGQLGQNKDAYDKEIRSVMSSSSEDIGNIVKKDQFETLHLELKHNKANESSYKIVSRRQNRNSSQVKQLFARVNNFNLIKPDRLPENINGNFPKRIDINNFNIFTYARRSHWSFFQGYDFELFGERIKMDEVDLKKYQDLLIFAFIKNHIPPGSRLLEVGGGNSRICKYFATLYECWNIDKLEGVGNGPKRLKKVPYRLVIDYMGNFNPKLPDNYFDFVFSISALEHVPQNDFKLFDNIINDINRVLKPGGYSLHLFDVVFKDNKLRANKFIKHIFDNVNTVNDYIPLEKISDDSDIYFLSEYAYNKQWKKATGKKYSEFGRPTNISVLWNKIEQTLTQDKINFQNINNSIYINNVAKFFIFTQAFNAEKTIDNVIESVINQAGNFTVHFHVQDKGSTDETLEKIKSWKSSLSNINLKLQCVEFKFTFSESYHGFYDNTFKAFETIYIRPNDYITLLKSNDTLSPGVLNAACNFFNKYPEAQWVGEPKHINIDTECRQHQLQNGIFFKKRLWFRTKHAIYESEQPDFRILWREMACYAQYNHLEQAYFSLTNIKKIINFDDKHTQNQLHAKKKMPIKKEN